MYLNQCANSIDVIIIIEIAVGKIQPVGAFFDLLDWHVPAKCIGKDCMLVFRFLEIERHDGAPNGERG